MNTTFDDLAREIAKGTSRRDLFRGLMKGLGGLLLMSLGMKKASAAVVCGTCQACNLDTNTCGLPCNPPSAGATLCTMASGDGSYLRLANYLTSKGFSSIGASDSVTFYQGGLLIGSGLITNFAGTATPGQSATISYVVGPSGDITTFALVLNNGVASFALTVDPSGRVVQTAATQTVSSSTNSSSTSSFRTGTLPQQDTRMAATGVLRGDSTTSTLPPGQCALLFDVLCGKVGGGIVCGALGAVLCIKFGPLAAAVCGIVAGVICSFPSDAVCKAEEEKICACPLNEQVCNGMCCGPCMDCEIGPGAPQGQCVPNQTCANNGLGPCCGNSQCCPANFTCDTTTNPPSCKSPNSGCQGATCQTFVPCSSSNPDCVCGTITEGGGLCVPGSTPCAGLTPCGNSGDCGPNALCLVGSCCGEPVCVPIALSSQCPATATGNVMPTLTQQRVAGPTIGHL